MAGGGLPSPPPKLKPKTPSGISLLRAKNGLDNGVHFTGMITVTGYTGDVCGNGLNSMIPGNNQNCLLPLEGGDTGGVTGTAVNTGGYLTFSFGFARKITEFTFVFIESTTATFEFRGSNDNVNWTVLTPASALASGPTVFSAASNTTNYLYYQLLRSVWRGRPLE